MRVDPGVASPELRSLCEFLDFHRATLKWKLDGVSQADANKPAVATSRLTLASIAKHLALVEDHWFQSVLVGRDLPLPWSDAPFDLDPDWDFHSAADDSLESIVDLYDRACERSRQAAKQFGELDAMSIGTDKKSEHFSLRWIMLHMIEETARHNGHADLLREAIDGATGE